MLVALLAAGYVGGGVVWAWRVTGATGRPSLRWHHHHSRWLEVAALVKDGLAFARQRGGGRMQASRRARQPADKREEKQGRHEQPEADKKAKKTAKVSTPLSSHQQNNDDH